MSRTNQTKIRVQSSTMLEEKPQKKPVPPEEPNNYKPPSTAEKLTVLSIDGGGTRGIIPAVALCRLEKYLQKNDGKHVRIADYFDVIAGSGMGSIIAAMLTVPDDKNERPHYTMKEIKNSLVEIFGTVHFFHFTWILKYIPICNPQYYFKRRVCNQLKKTPLGKTFSKVVIPVFDGKNRRPFIFSSSQPEADQILLSDAVFCSSAMHAYLEPHKIKYQGEYRSFNDGGLVSNNPTLFALQEAEKLSSKTEPDYANYLVLSLGTVKRHGFPEHSSLLSHWIPWASRFVQLGYLFHWGSRFVQYVYDTFSDATEIYMTQLLHRNKNYLRIQAYKEDFLDPIHNPAHNPVPGIIDGSSESIKRLTEIGKNILDENHLTYINPYTGELERQSEGNKKALNKKALKEFASNLSKERGRRLNGKQMQKKV